MANSFGTDFLIRVPDLKAAAKFYVEQLGFDRDLCGLIYDLTSE